MLGDELRRAADTAAAIAREAGAIVRERFALPRRIATKSAPVDLVTDTDRAADELISRRLEEAFPAHARVTEEGGARRHPASAPVSVPPIHWVVDPLDGTTNFAHGFPQFAVSIAAVEGLDAREPLAVDSARRGRALIGIVYDPMRDELFRATVEESATCNGAAISTTDEGEAERCLVATGFPYDRRERADFYLSYWREVMTRCRDVRRVGAAALDLAWVACGRVDAFWEWGLKPWDVAAGTLLVRQAGGRTSDFRGADPGVDALQTLASNGPVHDALVGILAALDRQAPGGAA